MADEVEERIKAKAAAIVAAVPESEQDEAIDTHLRAAVLLYRRLIAEPLMPDTIENLHESLDEAVNQTAGNS